MQFNNYRHLVISDVSQEILTECVPRGAEMLRLFKKNRSYIEAEILWRSILAAVAATALDCFLCWGASLRLDHLGWFFWTLTVTSAILIFFAVVFISKAAEVFDRSVKFTEEYFQDDAALDRLIAQDKTTVAEIVFRDRRPQLESFKTEDSLSIEDTQPEVKP
jgi:hypothetical protein